MLIQLASHNADINQLLEKGYALRIDSSHLVVRDIPYLDNNLDLKWGAFVAKLVFVDNVCVRQDNHQVYFAGSMPYGLNGRPIPNIGGGEHKITLGKDDVVVERAFSNKRKNDKGELVEFKDFFDKIEHYKAVVSGPAISKYGANPHTHRVDPDVAGDTVFKFHDTLTSRAEIGDLVQRFKKEVVAVIGLGGTGSYVLDFLVKTPVKEIRAFDGDELYIHNAYRSPGRLQSAELGRPKAEVYSDRYENFRHGLTVLRRYLGRDDAEALAGVTFAFVCVDKGSARAEIFDLLISLGIDFIDVGMGLNRKHGPLAGQLRVTTYPAGRAAEIRDKNYAELVDAPDAEYRVNVQISELNALNAAAAVMRYKQLRGFYADDISANQLLFIIRESALISETVA